MELKETLRQRHRVLRVLGEMIVVVSSILIAFALDAWWESRSLRRDLDQDLFNVGRELQANAETLKAHVRFLDQIVAATDGLLETMDAQSDRAEVLAADTLVYLAIASPRLILSLGALDALTASGRLSAVDDVDLRLFLAGFRERYVGVAREELLAQDVSYNRLLPAIEPIVDLGAVLGPQRRIRAARLAGEPLPTSALVSFPNNPSVRNILERRRQLHTVSRDAMAELIDAVELRLRLSSNVIRQLGN